MLRKIFVSLTLCVSCAFLLAACGTETTTTNNTSPANNSNTATVTTTNTTTTTSSPATTTTTTTSTPTTASAAKIGVPECDDYIAKYEACFNAKVPEAARAQYKTSLEQMRKSWATLAANPQTKASLAAACKTATESARTAMKTYGCDF